MLRYKNKCTILTVQYIYIFINKYGELTGEMTDGAEITPSQISSPPLHPFRFQSWLYTVNFLDISHPARYPLLLSTLSDSSHGCTLLNISIWRTDFSQNHKRELSPKVTVINTNNSFSNTYKKCRNCSDFKTSSEKCYSRSCIGVDKIKMITDHVLVMLYQCLIIQNQREKTRCERTWSNSQEGTFIGMRGELSSAGPRAGY